MKMKYKFLEHTADIMFEAYGKTLNELFENAALATEETMIELKEIKLKTLKEVEFKNDNVEKLLYDFLSELIFLKDAELLLFSKIKVKIKLVKKIYELKAILSGERLTNKHKQKVDVKAVTFHKFKIEKINNNYLARVILDI